MSDFIERQESKGISEINKFIDGLEEIFADLRERHVDDSVCGLCEYDGAYMGQSGDWCNECPGFDKDDCFKLSDETRKKWIEEIVNTYPDHTADIGKKVDGDCISRQWLMECVSEGWIKFDTEKDENRFIHLVRDIAPSAQPEAKWTPCSKRMPEEGQKCLVCDKGSIGIDTYIGHGNPYNWKWYTRDYEAWMSLPELYRGGEK